MISYLVKSINIRVVLYNFEINQTILLLKELFFMGDSSMPPSSCSTLYFWKVFFIIWTVIIFIIFRRHLFKIKLLMQSTFFNFFWFMR